MSHAPIKPREIGYRVDRVCLGALDSGELQHSYDKISES